MIRDRDHSKIDFSEIQWQENVLGMRSKTVVRDRKRFRLVEFSPGFVEEEWCLRAHAGYVLEGEFVIQFKDRQESFTAGDAILIAEGKKHRAIVTDKSVEIFLVEDV